MRLCSHCAGRFRSLQHHWPTPALSAPIDAWNLVRPPFAANLEPGRAIPLPHIQCPEISEIERKMVRKEGENDDVVVLHAFRASTRERRGRRRSDGMLKPGGRVSGPPLSPLHVSCGLFPVSWTPNLLKCPPRTLSGVVTRQTRGLLNAKKCVCTG